MSDLSAAQVAAEFGVARSTVYGLKNATFTPGDDLAAKVEAFIAKERELRRSDMETSRELMKAQCRVRGRG